jgi:(p)ppGpp synthase/HD superfamily hydrolase
MDDSMLFDAIEFAARAHRGQFRKGSRIPYIFHPLAVGRLLLDAGYENEITIAGFLHDTVEDSNVTLPEIASLFGERVATLVESSSEKNKADTWENRKLETIDKLGIAEPDIVALSCADKLDNIRSIRQDMDAIGDEVWNRFNRPMEKQKWYYTSLLSIFSRRLTDLRLVDPYRVNVEAVFGRAD